MSNKLEVSLNAVLNVPVIKVNGENISSALDEKANSSHTHISSQLTDLNALKIEIFKMIYPIGSVYTTFEYIMGAYVSNDKIYVEWNDCVWVYLDSHRFLRNASVSLDGDGISINYEAAGDTGGNENHTHSLDGRRAYACCGFGNQIGYPGHFYMERESATPTFSTQYGGYIESNGEWHTTIKGTAVRGQTESTSSLPPYTTCYMYKRIA